MSELVSESALRAKLGLDVFKIGGPFHIEINEGHEKDEALDRAIKVCPAGLYSRDESGVYHVSEDGCLECGSCKIACGNGILSWRFPDGGTGVQFRF
ncbi:ferredoxin family protein [Slackia isoflavoniconvertens]|uniref:ferredoxin family protein n=1 Tax=Slackia isoflavoniconvertens TaxID=572010 RepID=UPI002E7621C4|nr:4Fe-4S dicluster domain-containing protein [Slackia isoflavoniconvertens]